MKKYFVFLLLIVDLHAAQSVRLARAVRVARELRLSMRRAPVVRPKFAEIPLPQPVPKNKSRVPANALIECPNCGDEKPADQMMQLSCGDVYCKACLADQIKDAIKSRDDKALHCMHHLDSLFTEQELRELAAFDRAIDLDAVLYLLAQKVAESIPGYRHCPTADCPSVFIYEEVPGRRPMPYRCTACNRVYCPACLEQHDPSLTCAQAKVAKEEAEAKAAEEPLYNKEDDFGYVACPKCAKDIYKGPACTHLLCGSLKGPYLHYYKPELGCGHEFCFGCLRPWNECRNVACNRRDEAKLVEMKASIDRLKDYKQHAERQAKMRPHDPYYKDEILGYNDAIKTLEPKFAQAVAEWKSNKAKERDQVVPKAMPKR